MATGAMTTQPSETTQTILRCALENANETRDVLRHVHGSLFGDVSVKDSAHGTSADTVHSLALELREATEEIMRGMNEMRGRLID